MNRWLIAAGSTLLMLAGCTSSPESAANVCAADIGVGEVQPFAMPTPSRTEGITFDEAGNLFVSALVDDENDDDQLLEVMLDGTNDVAAEAESILGLASHPTGIIAAGIRTGDVLLIDPATGLSDVIAHVGDEPNFVVTTPWGTILVSDDGKVDEDTYRDTIREVTFEGVVSVWVEGVPAPNGMVFSLDESTLYVASTFSAGAGLWRVPVSEDGSAGTPEKWVDFGGLITADGLAIDSVGNVYVALNLPGQIAQVTPDGSYTIIAQGVDTTASIAFGRGEFDPCSLYSTSLFGDPPQLWRVGIGIPGPEQ